MDFAQHRKISVESEEREAQSSTAGTQVSYLGWLKNGSSGESAYAPSTNSQFALYLFGIGSELSSSPVAVT